MKTGWIGRALPWLREMPVEVDLLHQQLTQLRQDHQRVAQRAQRALDALNATTAAMDTTHDRPSRLKPS